MTFDELAKLSINTIRFLAADAVQTAQSGHPGLPMGAAPLAYVLWTRHLRYDPADPQWPNRDRFVLSAGHGSMLLYAMLHLVGYDLPMEQIKRFRQWESQTPGHPEYGDTPGVETTTGPLGQGFSNGVGMALAAAHQSARFNRTDFPIVDHRVYGIVSDGDLMEGIGSEAASLAGHLRLGNLIYLYDDNFISIDGSTALTFTEDREARFRAYGWHVQRVEDGLDLQAIDGAIENAKHDPRPSLVACRTIIGYGLPTRAGTAAAHGEPPGLEELAGAKAALGWPQEPWFLVPDEVYEHMRVAGVEGARARSAWQELMDRYRAEHRELGEEWDRTHVPSLPDSLDEAVPTFDADGKGMATRASSGQTLNALAPLLPELIGGSADLTGSNKTDVNGEHPFDAANPDGRYLHFGVREHGMGGILNGIALYGGLIPYGGTFLVFSDYMRPSIRLAALMGLRVIYVFTHDSIGLGEDGPTHQPIEHLAALRAIPNLSVIRPADANETTQAWLAALQRESGPTALALTRQSVPTIDRHVYSPASGLLRGAYVLADIGDVPPRLVLMASGSEVEIIMAAGQILAAEGIAVRLVSFPSWELFVEQPQDYRDQVLPPDLASRIAVEAGVAQGWERWVGEGGQVVALDRFGASAPYKEIYAHLGLTADRVVREAVQLLHAQPQEAAD